MGSSVSEEEKAASPSSGSLHEDLDGTIDEKKLLRKIDGRVMPMLFLIYLGAFLDRVNISNALTMSMPKDLGLTGEMPNIALTVFFVPYVIFEIPSNVLMKKFSPHVWLSGCILLFGIVMLAQGFVQSYGGLLATRFLLGLAEAGIFPGSFYLISFWYKREEAQKRFTIYWSSVLMAGAFGGLLASAIANMDGVRGLANWRWIFILEGMVTIIIGIASFIFVTDFPREAKWLTPKEKEFVLAKTQADEAHTSPVSVSSVLAFFKDPKQVLGAIMYFSVVVPIYAFAFFTPTIIATLGKMSVVQIQLHSVPPFAVAFGFCIVSAYLSDMTRLRSPFIAVSYVLLIAGLVTLLAVDPAGNFSAEYAAVCLVCMGAFTAGAGIVCWYLMNLHGHTNRSIGSAWMIGFGNTGGVVATFAFPKADSPRYRTGYSICLAVTCVGAAATALYFLLVLRERRAAAKASEGEKKANPPPSL